MATKAQIARKKYGMSLQDLSSGQRAAVTREYNAQRQNQDTYETYGNDNVNTNGFVTAKFGRPGVNGLKECLIADHKSVGDAIAQAGITLNTSKEGVMDKETGNTIMLNDTVKDGVIYMIVPGIDSSN